MLQLDLLYIDADISVTTTGMKRTIDESYTGYCLIIGAYIDDAIKCKNDVHILMHRLVEYIVHFQWIDFGRSVNVAVYCTEASDERNATVIERAEMICNPLTSSSGGGRGRSHASEMGPVSMRD